MVQIDIEYQGELRCRLTHAPSGTPLLTDAPVDNHGKGESFSPTDLVAGALGACMVTIMGIAADKHGWDLKGTTVTVEKHMTADPVRRIGRVEVRIRVPLDLDAKARAILERAAATCPVHKSIHPDIGVSVTFEYGS